MEELILKYGLLILCYLIGSIPFSVILGVKLKGIDIRNHGSGNPGSTNALRFLGKGVGITIMILDGLKSGLIVLLMTHFNFLGGYDMLHPLAYGVAATIGHVFPLYIKFKGGKAVACTVGLSIGYNPIWAIIMLIGFLGTLKTTKYVSLASTAAGVTGLLVALIWGEFNAAFYYAILLLIITYRHQTNYKNIKNGIEPKVTWI